MKSNPNVSSMHASNSLSTEVGDRIRVQFPVRTSHILAIAL